MSVEERLEEDGEIIQERYFAAATRPDEIKGKLFREENWLHGKRHGPYIEYYESAPESDKHQLKLYIDYHNGLAHGKCELYDTCGDCIVKATAVNGKLDGEQYKRDFIVEERFLELDSDNLNADKGIFHGSGTVHCHYSNGQLHGKFTKSWYEANSRDTLIVECHYFNNELDDEFKLWHQSSEWDLFPLRHQALRRDRSLLQDQSPLQDQTARWLAESGRYHQGRKQGVWRNYGRHCNSVLLTQQAHYVDGKLDGDYKSYCNGKLTECGQYQAGRKIGTHQIWQESDERRWSVTITNYSNDGKELSKITKFGLTAQPPMTDNKGNIIVDSGLRKIVKSLAFVIGF